MINVGVTNGGGGVGKTIIAMHMLEPLVPNSSLISVEDWNSGAGEAAANCALEIGADEFLQFAPQMVTDMEQGFILDIGASSSKALFKLFNSLESVVNKIDFWIVPLKIGARERIDTLKTIDELIHLGVAPNAIVVVANAIMNVKSFDEDVAGVKLAAEKSGFHFASQAILYSEAYSMIRPLKKSVFDLVNEPFDSKSEIRNAGGNRDRLQEVGNMIVLRDFAKAAASNLLAVFQSTPLARAIESDEVRA